MIPILQMAYYWDLDLIQDDTHEDASNKEMTNIKMCLTKMMMQRCVWDFLPAGAVSVRLTRPSGSSTCSIEPLILAGCGIDFLFLFVFVFCVFCLFFLIGFASIEPLRQGGCGVGWSVYFLCFCCLCFYLSVFIGPESDHWQCLSITNWLTPV